MPAIGFFAVLIAHLRVVRDRLDALSNHWSNLLRATRESRVIALLLTLQRESSPTPRQRTVHIACG